MSNAISGVGTKFFRWNTAGHPHDGSSDQADGAWEAIAEITSISGPSKSRETIDVTSLDSEGGYREFIASIRSGGTVSLNMNFTRATYQIMNDDFEDDTVQNYRIEIPDAYLTVLDFSGLVTELPLEISVDDKITANVTIQVSGKPVLGSKAAEDDYADSQYDISSDEEVSAP